MSGAIKNVIMVPSGSAKDAIELATSYSFDWNHWAVNLLGNPALNAFAIDDTIMPNKATG